MSDTSNRGLRITIVPHYVAEQSNPGAGQYLFTYRVTIANEGTQTLQLRARHWVITDGENHVEEVRGPGVVGRQPVLAPGERFEYTSGCPLKTPVGTMHGSFQMVDAESGESFEALISPFRLAVPGMIN